MENMKELNMEKMELVNGAGFLDDLKKFGSCMGTTLKRWNHIITDAIVESDKKNREGGDPTPSGVAWAIGMGFVQGVINVGKDVKNM